MTKTKIRTYNCGCQFIFNENNRIIFEPKISNINLECPKTWDLFCEGNTKGVFQLDSQLGQSHSEKLKPRNMEELSALLAIIRPGTSEAIVDGKSLTQHFIDRKNGIDTVDYFHPVLESVLKPTYGILVYQEQALFIAKDVAGFNLQEADILRKAIGKKKPEEMAKVKKMFLAGAKKLGVVNKEEAEEIFSWIEKSQRYSFNKCISGNTRLFREKGKHSFYPTVEEMYLIRNNIEYAKQTGHLSLYKKWKLKNNYGTTLSLCKDGKLKPNIIKNIYYSGKKPTWKITLKNNKYIIATSNHKFPTSKGIKRVYDLLIGDELYLKGKYDSSPSRKYNWSSKTLKDVRRNVTSHDHITRGFMSGKNNPGYTNGEYSKWKSNVLLLEDYCYSCGKKHKRLEVHHIDSNRKNNELENLEKLCPSCHKKKEYKYGRVKKGEKGYPSYLVKIKHIKYVGEIDVYDVEMAYPNHNFVTDQGIVTCNSHSISYAYNSYLDAFCKAHFPREFFTSALYYARFKPKTSEEVNELVSNTKKMDIDVRKPDLLKFNKRFSLIDNDIYYGLTDIKGVGDSVFESLTKAIHNVEKQLDSDYTTWNWADFLIFISPYIKSDAFKFMIDTGVFDLYKEPRIKMANDFNKYSQLKEREQDWIKKFKFLNREATTIDCFVHLVTSPTGKKGGIYQKKRVADVDSLLKSLTNPGFKLKDSPYAIAKVEKELLGIEITYSKLDECDTATANCTCKDFYKKNNPLVPIIAVIIDRLNVIKCKKGKSIGKEMAFLTVSDSTCSLESVTIFPNEWKEFKCYCESGKTVLITGNRDAKTNALIIKKIWEI